MIKDWCGYWLKAPLRWWRTRGFGIHSPFAFCFVSEVLRERYAYYAYERIGRLVAERGRDDRLSFSGAKTLFRIAARLDCREAVLAGYVNNSAVAGIMSLVRKNMPVLQLKGHVKPVGYNAIMIVESVEDSTPVAAQAIGVLDKQGVVIVRNLARSEKCRDVEQRIVSAMTDHGAQFCNGRSTVFVGLRYLQPQRFNVNLPF